MKTLAVLAVLVLAAAVAGAPTNETYTVNVANGLEVFTNVVEYPRRCSEFCVLVRYAKDGTTNDFHAAFVSMEIATNKAVRKK